MKYSRFFDWHASARKAGWIVRLQGVDAAAIEILVVPQRAGQDAKSLTLPCGG